MNILRVATVSVLLLLILAACNSSRARIQPGTASVFHERESVPHTTLFSSEVEQRPDGTTITRNTQQEKPGVERVKASGQSVGPSADVRGDKLSDNFSGQASTISLPNGPTATSGGFNKKTTATDLQSFITPLAVIGVLLLAGGAAVVFLVPGARTMGVMLGGVGIAFILAAAFPALVWFLVIIAVLAAVAYGIYYLRDREAAREGLRATLAAASDLSTDVRESFKDKLNLHAEPSDVTAIKKIEAADNLRL